MHTGVSVLQIYTPLPCCAGKIKGFYQTTPANNCGAIGKPQILYMYNQNMSPASQHTLAYFDTEVPNPTGEFDPKLDAGTVPQIES